MKFQSVSIGFGAILMLFTLAAHAETPASQQVRHGACALLNPEDLTKLMGSTPVGTSKKGACTWTVTGKATKIITTKFPDEGMAAEMAYSSAQKNASRGGPIIELKGIGDRGFARLNRIGVVIITVKNGKLLQVIYATGSMGTDKEVDALKPVVMKIISTF
jgi:hypothetical protein